MKAVTLLVSTGLLLGCSDNSRELTNVSHGMNKEAVVQAIGEPSRKNDIGVAELWTYPEYNKTLVFRADTVFDIVTSSGVRIDSIKSSLKDLGKDIKKEAKKVGQKLDTVEKKLEGSPKNEKNKDEK